MSFEPLRVTATLASDIANPMRPPALDALLAYVQAVYVERRPPPDPSKPTPLVHLDGVLELSACGRFHLASFAVSEPEEWSRGRFVNRRFPIAEAQAMGSAKITTLSLSGGPAKSFRIPLETAWLKGDRIDWYAVGDVARVRSMLAWVTHLGKRRGVGLGKIARWDVTPCDPWDLAAGADWRSAVWPRGGFPVVRDARPMRNLPLDTLPAELAQAFEGYGVVSYPYHERDREELCVIASSAAA